MKVTRNNQFGLPIFIVRGAIDFYRCKDLLGYLLPAIEEGHRKIALDLSEVERLDESGLQLLDTVGSWLAERSRSLRLIGLPNMNRRDQAASLILAA